jgi:hypothetical protein
VIRVVRKFKFGSPLLRFFLQKFRKLFGQVVVQNKIETTHASKCGGQINQTDFNLVTVAAQISSKSFCQVAVFDQILGSSFLLFETATYLTSAYNKRFAAMLAEVGSIGIFLFIVFCSGLTVF